MGGCLISAQAQACVDKVQSVPRDTDLRGQRRGVFLKSNTAGFPPLQSAQMQPAQAAFSVRVRSLRGGEYLTTSKDT